MTEKLKKATRSVANRWRGHGLRSTPSKSINRAVRCRTLRSRRHDETQQLESGARGWGALGAPDYSLVAICVSERGRGGSEATAQKARILFGTYNIGAASVGSPFLTFIPCTYLAFRAAVILLPAPTHPVGHDGCSPDVAVRGGRRSADRPYLAGAKSVAAANPESARRTDPTRPR